MAPVGHHPAAVHQLVRGAADFVAQGGQQLGKYDPVDDPEEDDGGGDAGRDDGGYLLLRLDGRRRRPPAQHDDEEVECHEDGDEGDEHSIGKHLRAPVAEGGLGVRQGQHAERHEDEHPRLAVDE